RFKTALVAAALGQQWATLEYYLDKLAREGWLIRQGDDFQFGHDRFQQAVLNRLNEKEQAGYHYKVAQALEATLDVEEQEEYLFEWVRHANQGATHRQDADRPDLLYQLNFRAGVKARTSAAFQEALIYFQRCLHMLPRDAWDSSFSQALEVYQALADTAYQAGDMDQADHYLEILFDHTENIDHTLFAHELRMQTLLFRNKFTEATDWGIQLLRTLGVEVPNNPGAKIAKRYERRTKRLLKGVTAHTIKSLPTMMDNRAKAISRILYDLSTPVYFANRNYVSILGYLLMRQLLDSGISAWSAYAITQYAFVESVDRGNIEEGIKWGAMGVELARDRHLIEILPKSILIQNVFMAHWKETYPDTVLEMEKGLQSAMEIGNYEIATNLVHNMINQTYYAGVPLTEVIRFSDDLDAQIKRFRIDNVIIRLQSYRQGFVNLMEYDELGPDRLKGELFDEDQVPASESSNPLFKINVLLNKLHLSIYYHYPERALGYAEDSFAYLETAKGAHTFTWFYFHYALALAGAIRQGSAPRTRLVELHRQVQRLQGYVQYGPRSFQQKYLLVKAEYDGLMGKHRKAKDGYSEALKVATQHARVNDEALIWEWGGIYYLEQRDEIMGNFYLENAFRAYRRWGATGKLQQMILDRPGLFGKYKLREQADRQYSLDLSTILKASATLSSEIQLSKLLSTLMNILLENAGADQGVFVLESDSNWHIMASGHSEEGIVTNQRIPLTGSGLVPEMVIETVKLMSKPVLIDDAQLSNPYSGDPYFQTHATRSVLCLPINAQGRMLGIVYLSNSLTSGIFTEQRLDLLEMLSGQIGISVENALMYEDLDRKVQERTEELKDTLEQLKEKNMQVEAQNQEVTDSIAYGKTIQQAMLPEEKQLLQTLGEAFVFFRPRDQVSGDFYWYVEVKDYILVAAVDCTGHGVPGAFMSMIGIQLLDSIVKVQGITRPDEILNHLQRGVDEALRHEEYVLMDGMDLGICRVHKNARTVDFAGAKNSLVYVDSEGVHRVRGAHASLSGDLRSSSLVFDLHKLHLESGVMCYLYSDGFQDQFGGPHDKKFKANNFREFLGEISFLPAAEQKVEIAEAFRAWKGDRDQTDDVMVLGFRV
ncbi:MAG: SpoIIE family protein phosphatase, partial [Bacteroidota bacterium]